MASRLSPEEREARRKERVRRSFTDAAYRHYDPATEGYGSADEWIRQADELLFGKGLLRDAQPTTQLQRDLEYLMLDKLPESAELLKRAFRNVLFVVHPDHGGSHDATIAAMDAFKRLSKHY